ncbi:hypothetical protein OSTOST_21057 [Ostertagia ostertagi]
MSIRTTTTLPESVETFRLPTILATLPIHIFTAVFITIVMISVQECSAIRNFVYNPIATQAFVDALERFLMAFFNYDMPISIVFILYCLFPLFCVAMAIYNTFISSSLLLQTDDICSTVRRTQAGLISCSFLYNGIFTSNS